MALEKNLKIYFAILAIFVICASSFVVAYKFSVNAQPYVVGVNISSSATKISPGENVTLTASVLNGSAPYSYQWYAKIWQNENDSQPFVLFSSSNPAIFTLNDSCVYINFGVQVTDSQGNFGENYSITVYDPVVMNSMYSEGGVFPGAPDYTIWGESHSGTTTYYAKNSYGHVSYSSTDASTVSNDVMNSLASSGGGTVYYETGNYTFTQTGLKTMALVQGYAVLVPSNVIVEGSGYNTVFTTAAGANCTIFFNSNYGNATSDLSTWNSGIVFKNFRIEGQLETQPTDDASGGIAFWYAHDSIVQNVFINGTDGTGVYWRNCWNMKLEYSNGTNIKNPLVSLGATNSSTVEGCTSINNLDDGPVWFPYGPSYGDRIINNFFYNNFNETAIRLQAASPSFIEYCVIAGNYIANFSGSPYAGIQIGPYAYNNIISENTIDGMPQNGIWVDSDNNTVTANIITNSGRCGILDDGNFTVITLNTVLNSSALEANYDGIRIDAYFMGTLVSLNHVDGGTRCIREITGANYNFIVNNVVGTSQYSPNILITGANTTSTPNFQLP